MNALIIMPVKMEVQRQNYRACGVTGSTTWWFNAPQEDDL